MATEKRLIDANYLMKAIRERTTGSGDDFDIIMTHLYGIVEAVPTVDAVEVVRCKDCEHWNQAKMISPYQCVCEKFTNAPYIYNYRSRNDFCSYGERKDK